MTRERLLDRVTASTAPLTTIVAPAGYGKTTLLRQWAERTPDVAFLRLDQGDDDPAVLLSYLAAALDRVEPLVDDVASLLASPVASVERTLLPRFTQALWAMSRPVVLMLDECQVLSERAALDVLAWVITHQPPRLRLAIASRWTLELPVARLRAEGRLLEIGAADLALDAHGVLTVSAARGLRLSDAQADGLRASTEGWPAAVYLALMSATERGSDPTVEPAARGTEASLADYMRDELLNPLAADDQAFVVRASALETLTGPLCDAALETSGSLARLRHLERRNLFVVPVDQDRSGYRFHHLFGEFLRDELEVRQPAAANTIRARAAAWCEANGAVEQAMEYAHAAGDLEAVARMMASHSLPMFWSGRLATVERWASWFDHDGLRDRWAHVAVHIGWLKALQGRTKAAEHWLIAAERAPDRGPMPDGSRSKEPWVATLRAGMARDGVTTMVADVDLARAGLPPDSPWWSGLLNASVAADLMRSEVEAAARTADEAVELAETRAAASALAIALGARASIALQRGETLAARRDASRGLQVVEGSRLQDYPNSAFLYVVGARLAIAAGSTADGLRLIRAFDILRPSLTAAIPWVAVPARLHAVRAHVALGDAAAARTLLLEVSDVLRVRPDLGSYTVDAAGLQQIVREMHSGAVGAGTLTAAEIRLLAFLPTHLTFREIAERLYVSPHTVKTQAISIYAKLGVSSRRGAIEEAVAAGLLDDSVIRFPAGTAGVG